MKKPSQRKHSQRTKELTTETFTPEALEKLATSVKYIGSPEHKKAPSFAGRFAPRADAEICNTSLHGKQDLIKNWLQEAIKAAHFSKIMENGFPRHIWAVIDNQHYEARLTNQGNGSYKGYPISQDKCPLSK
jgi:hypothetical protein